MPESKFVQLYLTVIAILLALAALLRGQPGFVSVRDWLLPVVLGMSLLIKLALLEELSVIWRELGGRFPRDIFVRIDGLDELSDRRLSGFALANVIFVSLPPTLAILLLVTSS